MTNTLMLPMTTHVALASLLYVLLTIARAPKVWGVSSRYRSIALLMNAEPRISANLSNQFEWPLFFHAACILLLTRGHEIDAVQLWLAWIFVAGRVAHSLVQVLTTNVRLRGAVFTVNFLAVLAMWIYTFLAELQ